MQNQDWADTRLLDPNPGPSLTLTSPRQQPPRKAPARALELVEQLAARIQAGQLRAGDKLPAEADLMVQFGVSRTVVRDALTSLKARGLIYAHQGLGTFVATLNNARPFSIDPASMHTLPDLLAVLELRMGLEPEAAAMAAQRRTEAHLQQLRQSLDAVTQAWLANLDPVGADFRFHCEIARASQSPHYIAMMGTLSPGSLPRCWQTTQDPVEEGRRNYLDHVADEHEEIYSAILHQQPEAARAAMRLHIAKSRERHRALEARNTAG